jgi:hypothetical protein
MNALLVSSHRDCYRMLFIRNKYCVCSHIKRKMMQLQPASIAFCAGCVQGSRSLQQNHLHKYFIFDCTSDLFILQDEGDLRQGQEPPAAASIGRHRPLHQPTTRWHGLPIYFASACHKVRAAPLATKHFHASKSNLVQSAAHKSLNKVQSAMAKMHFDKIHSPGPR